MIHLLETWHPKAPAADTVIAQLMSESPMQLPEAYIELLRVSNGGYADLSLSSWAVNFWAAENVQRLNQEYKVDQNAPNFLAFGSNLVEEMLANAYMPRRHSLYLPAISPMVEAEEAKIGFRLPPLAREQSVEGGNSGFGPRR